ncbi:mannose-1-phosphate guanylyltransferase/mannose-6-phosphate isomerase [Saccharospirillum sp. MSK14-1]|uniref:mannose-1-phosphate guanylyltransferase/mannose-6-phosphate isomerase n=1 Tax=Saccharospirillum sp. MSK14-1 TaxID=1897632 RepID=UPI0026B36B1B|nr:mannose-1-phosphate guanylyltransferase/mannose-6-phosphate isomerase [Saccharospirillum sp. MSK14-1]
MIIPVLLAGGVGSRLWPVSRELFPKQCISLIGTEHSLIQQTVERAQAAGMTEAPIVVCNDEHRFLIAQQMADLGTKSELILEPEGRNTAPAIALAALQAVQRDPQATLVVLPADHVIQDRSAFSAALQQAVEQAADDKLVTFGVSPSYAETGYGYIEAAKPGQISAVAAFREKPDAETAEGYLQSGRHYWNSGMFVFKARVYLDELKRHQPAIYAATEAAMAGEYSDLDFIRVDAEAFAKSPSDSIDYAIMEHTDRAVVVPYNGDWNDIGAWSALYDLNEKDADANALQGDVLTHDAHGNLIRAESRLVAAVGVNDLAIIETDDAVLVIPRERAQDVKEIVTLIKAGGRSEHQLHARVHRPWGAYKTINMGERHQVKRITVKPGEKLSVQMHHHRAEHWVVVSGTANVTIGEDTRMLSENESVYIPIGTVHALENPGKIPLELIEVQTGSYLGEDDIVRFTDRYGRS